jgi:hypothetical protein
MQHIPDKELDKLFKDKLLAAEIEPSPNLWGNIENQLLPKPKNSFSVFWLVAASIAVVITSFLFLKREEVVHLRGNSLPVTSLVKPADDVVSDNELKIEKLVKETGQKPVSSINIKLVNDINLGVNEVVNLKDTTTLQPNIQIARLPLKDIETRMTDVVPINTNLIEVETVSNYTLSDNETESLLNNTEDTPSDGPRKGIRNFGDLVNYVVDKVDKRDKKFIKFSTEDDSAITEINIGFLKLNSKKQK